MATACKVVEQMEIALFIVLPSYRGKVQSLVTQSFVEHYLLFPHSAEVYEAWLHRALVEKTFGNIMGGRKTPDHSMYQ